MRNGRFGFLTLLTVACVACDVPWAVAETVDFSITQFGSADVQRSGSDDVVLSGFATNRQALTRFGGVEPSTSGTFPIGDDRRFVSAESGITVLRGTVSAFNVTRAAMVPWASGEEGGSFTQSYTAGTFINGTYGESLTAFVAGKTLGNVTVEFLFYAPLTGRSAVAEADSESVGLARLNEGDNLLVYTVGGEQRTVSFGADVASADQIGRQESDPAPGYSPWVTLRAPVELGVPFTASIGLTLESFVSASGDSPAAVSAGLEFRHGISFAGARLFDAADVELDDFKLLNDSGTDFRHSFVPVPESDGLATGAAMLLLLSAAGARWRRSRANGLLKPGR